MNDDTRSRRKQTGSKAERRKQALKRAEACARLLEERFGARRVVLFGSLAGRGVWHERSDIDLAVEGVAPEEFLVAYSACREMLSPGLELDLVPLERVYPELKARILGEVEMPDDPIAALRALVEDELTALRRVVEEAEEILAGRPEPPTRVELRAMAGILHEFYNGVERIFERIAVGMGEGLPQGSNWHTDLLAQMASTPEGRPLAMIDQPLRARLKDYLDFRHFFRHAYGYTLEWNQLRWKVEHLPETFATLGDQLHAFFEALSEGEQGGERANMVEQ